MRYRTLQRAAVVLTPKGEKPYQLGETSRRLYTRSEDYEAIQELGQRQVFGA